MNDGVSIRALKKIFEVVVLVILMVTPAAWAAEEGEFVKKGGTGSMCPLKIRGGDISWKRESSPKRNSTEAKGFSRAGNASATPGTVSVMETVSTSKSAISFS